MEFRLRRFYQAFENGDKDEAVRAIRMALPIYYHMEERCLLQPGGYQERNLPGDSER